LTRARVASDDTFLTSSEVRAGNPLRTSAGVIFDICDNSWHVAGYMRGIILMLLARTGVTRRSKNSNKIFMILYEYKVEVY